MQTIIGLGKAGCSLAEHFKEYSQYSVYKIDEGLKKTKNTFGIKKQPSVEAYEKNTKTKLKDIEQQATFITSCGNISGASLKLLQPIKDKTKIKCIYIVPEEEDLSHNKKLQNKLLFNVFQEYARSDVFVETTLISNHNLNNIIGDVSVLQYWNKVNQLLASTYHMIEVFENTKPIMTNFSNRVKVAKISTIGLINWETNEENLFFKLDIPREKRYYYAIPEKMLSEDTTLMKKIKKQIKNGVEHDNMKVSYGIYATQYEQPFVYCKSFSSMIQSLPAL